MIERLRPYPEIAPTEVGWLSHLPTHWGVVRAKHVFREVDCRSIDGAETHLSMHQKLGLVPSASTGEKRLISENYAGGKLVEPDDLVLNRLKAHLGVFAHASQQGVISPDYTVLRPLPNAVVRYYEYLLKSPACRGELRIRIKGIVEGFWRLYTDDFYDIRLPVPSPDEQKLIVCFLDWHGAMTGKLIRAKRRLIALLDEQKQSIIHRAVTRGLDPTAKLKPSGVDWIGDVPEHWEVLPFHACYAEKAVPNIGMLESTVLSLSYGRIVIKPPEKLFGLVPASFETYQIVDPGDIIIRCTDLQNDKKSLRTGLSGHRGIITSAYLSLRPKNNLSCEFAHLILATYDALKIIYGYGSGLRQNLSFKDLKHMPIPVPPRDEQPQIISEIQRQTAEIEQAIQQCTKELALVAELRTRLIADVATGQLDVRDVAASLPEVAEGDAGDDLTEEGELDDDADDLIDEEEAA